MICGSYPPDVCGIGDYTAELVKALKQHGTAVEPLPRRRWNLLDSQRIVKEIRRSGCDIVHLQYPSEGYRTSLVPQWVSMQVPLVVTIHDFLNSRIERRLACIPFFLFAKRLVFTTRYELDGVARLFPWIRRKSVVIPIGTNIPADSTSRARSFDEILYFGLLAPHKGLEQVLKLAEMALADGLNLRVHIVGTFPPRLRAYAEDLMASARNLPVRWTLGKSPLEVSRILASSSVAFMPFPDGASERRGSLKAAVSAGVVCITTAGSQTPEDMLRAVVVIDTVEEAYERAKILMGDVDQWKRLSTEATNYARTFDWEAIAYAHRELYMSQQA